MMPVDDHCKYTFKSLASLPNAPPPPPSTDSCLHPLIAALFVLGIKSHRQRLKWRHDSVAANKAVVGRIKATRFILRHIIANTDWFHQKWLQGFAPTQPQEYWSQRKICFCLWLNRMRAINLEWSNWENQRACRIYSANPTQMNGEVFICHYRTCFRKNVKFKVDNVYFISWCGAVVHWRNGPWSLHANISLSRMCNSKLAFKAALLLHERICVNVGGLLQSDYCDINEWCEIAMHSYFLLMTLLTGIVLHKWWRFTIYKL